MFVEKLIQKGYEVIFFTEAIDEYVMTHLTEFDDKKFQDASKDDLKLGKDDRKGLKKLRVGAEMLSFPIRWLSVTDGELLRAYLAQSHGSIEGPLQQRAAA